MGGKNEFLSDIVDRDSRAEFDSGLLNSGQRLLGSKVLSILSYRDLFSPYEQK